eukprot:352891-Chlamydomonas_euryale.AAC.10
MTRHSAPRVLSARQPCFGFGPGWMVDRSLWTVGGPRWRAGLVLCTIMRALKLRPRLHPKRYCTPSLGALQACKLKARRAHPRVPGLAAMQPRAS